MGRALRWDPSSQWRQPGPRPRESAGLLFSEPIFDSPTNLILGLPFFVFRASFDVCFFLILGQFSGLNLVQKTAPFLTPRLKTFGTLLFKAEFKNGSIFHPQNGSPTPLPLFFFLNLLRVPFLLRFRIRKELRPSHFGNGGTILPANALQAIQWRG